jgi:hypothetical protein
MQVMAVLAGWRRANQSPSRRFHTQQARMFGSAAAAGNYHKQMNLERPRFDKSTAADAKKPCYRSGRGKLRQASQGDYANDSTPEISGSKTGSARKLVDPPGLEEPLSAPNANENASVYGSLRRLCRKRCHFEQVCNSIRPRTSRCAGSAELHSR